MTPKRLAALVLAALLVTAGAAAAAPGNAPADAGPNTDEQPADADGADDDSDESENADDEDDESEAPDDAAEESDDADENADSADAADENAQRGPPEELPSQASDRASSVLDTVRTFLNGGLDGNLGPALAR